MFSDKQLFNLFLGSPPFGHVAQNNGVELLSARVDLRDRSFNWELFAAGADSRERAQCSHRTFCHLSLPEPSNVLSMGRAKSLRNKSVNRLANSFLRGATKHPFRRGIENDNALFRVYGDDGVHRGGDDVGQLSSTLAQRLVGPLPVGNVAIGLQHQPLPLRINYLLAALDNHAPSFA